EESRKQKNCDKEGCDKEGCDEENRDTENCEDRYEEGCQLQNRQDKDSQEDCSQWKVGGQQEVEQEAIDVSGQSRRRKSSNQIREEVAVHKAVREQEGDPESGRHEHEEAGRQEGSKEACRREKGHSQVGRNERGSEQASGHEAESSGQEHRR
ncbi:hypothetical protein, partial [Dokdonella sp.]|uniref:hypothetical protein n=1 Tax=Dokdonella sp. TaxID=2291710 RepID=UPI003C54FD5E